MREEEAQVRWWAEDDADLDQKEPSFCGDKRALSSEAAAEEDYYCRREATPRPSPSPISDYAVDPAPEEAPAQEEEPAPEAAPVHNKVSVYFSGQRMWSGAAAPKRARRVAKKERCRLIEVAR